MKLKITICGSKVHDVGYRPYLMELAFGLCLRGFEVFNDELNDQQSVVALIEGDEARVNSFRKMATSTQTPLASVERVLVEDYQGEIMPAWQSANIGTFSVMNRAISLLPAIRDGIKEMKRDVRKSGRIPIPSPMFWRRCGAFERISSPDMPATSGRCRRTSGP